MEMDGTLLTYSLGLLSGIMLYKDLADFTPSEYVERLDSSEMGIFITKNTEQEAIYKPNRVLRLTDPINVEIDHETKLRCQVGFDYVENILIIVKLIEDTP